MHFLVNLFYYILNADVDHPLRDSLASKPTIAASASMKIQRCGKKR